MSSLVEDTKLSSYCKANEIITKTCILLDLFDNIYYCICNYCFDKKLIIDLKKYLTNMNSIAYTLSYIIEDDIIPSIGSIYEQTNDIIFNEQNNIDDNLIKKILILMNEKNEIYNWIFEMLYIQTDILINDIDYVQAWTQMKAIELINLGIDKTNVWNCIRNIIAYNIWNNAISTLKT